MIVSVIDIGSNTIKASIFKISSSGKRTLLGYKGFKTKLISCVEETNCGRFLSVDGQNKLYDAVFKLINFSNEYCCDNIYAFATASLRGVDNSNEILKTLKDKFELVVEILSGEEEALCSLKGLLSEQEMMSVKEGIMIDMGGGSTELVYFVNGEIPKMTSLTFGCLSLYKKFVKGHIPVKSEENEISAYVNEELKKCEFVKNSAVPVFLIGGSARAILKIAKGIKSNGTLQTNGADFDTVLSKFSDLKFLEKAEEIIPGRTTTVCPSAIAFKQIMRHIVPSSINVCESGVREGYLEKILP